jgi:hypothetical protein
LNSLGIKSCRSSMLLATSSQTSARGTPAQPAL